MRRIRAPVVVAAIVSDASLTHNRSAELQQVRAGQKLSAVEALQTNEAGYGGAELKIGAVPPERGRLHDRHGRGVNAIDQHRTPLCSEEPRTTA
jgi:hypothetical protein